MNGGKIVLYIDPLGGTDIMAELGQAVSLARKLGAGMDAVLLSNEELLRAASLPMTRQVGQSSAKILPFEVADLHEQINFLRREVEHTLAQALGNLQLPWTVAVRSGPLRAQCDPSGCRGDEWLAITGSRMKPQRILGLFASEPGFLITRKVMVTRATRDQQSPRGLAAVVAPVRFSETALRLCRTLAGWLSSRQDLALFTPKSPDEVALSSRDILYRLEAGWEPEKLLTGIENLGASLIILVSSPETSPADQARLKLLLEQAELPVVILPDSATSQF